MIATPSHPRKIRSDGWTPERQTSFIAALATQSVAAAAASVGMSRQSAYRLRGRSRDPALAAAWRGPESAGEDVLFDAIDIGCARAYAAFDAPANATGLQLLARERRRLVRRDQQQVARAADASRKIREKDATA